MANFSFIAFNGARVSCLVLTDRQTRHIYITYIYHEAWRIINWNDIESSSFFLKKEEGILKGRSKIKTISRQSLLESPFASGGLETRLSKSKPINIVPLNISAS